jgi:hypothetical protein
MKFIKYFWEHLVSQLFKEGDDVIIEHHSHQVSFNHKTGRFIEKRTWTEDIQETRLQKQQYLEGLGLYGENAPMPQKGSR